MILKWIILISIGQIKLYLISDRLKLKHASVFIFLPILIGHFFILPKYFYPEPDPDGVNCGMPILGVTLAFWIFGGGIASGTHLIYYLIKKKKTHINRT